MIRLKAGTSTVHAGPPLTAKMGKRKRSALFELSSNRSLYLMTLPGIVILFLFCYLPMAGLRVAFSDYNVVDGIFGSPFVWFDNFKFFVTDGERAFRTVGNTLILNSFFILTGLVFQIGIALCINEINSKFFKRIAQSVMFFPYFLSWVVIGSIIYSLFASDVGVVNGFLKSVGLQPVRWYGEPGYWKAIVIGANVWKWSGYGSIVYLAAMSNFDTSLYEAAKADGATRLQQIAHITLPLLKPTAVVLVLFSIGRIFYGDFGMIYGIVNNNGILLQTVEVIDTYVFLAMRTTLGFAGAACIGIIQSIMGLIMILGANKIAKRLNDGQGLF